MKPEKCTEQCNCLNCPDFGYSWWQEQSTSIVHFGHRVINKYEVFVCQKYQTDFYSGKSKQEYEN